MPNDELVDDSDPEYRLVALIDLKGKTLEKSRYTAFVKRKSTESEGKYLWFSFHKDKKHIHPQDEVLQQTMPQLLVYLQRKQ